jgi:hypothetical protein
MTTEISIAFIRVGAGVGGDDRMSGIR